MLHVKCCSDNTSDDQWCNRLHSKKDFSQQINRAIGLAEAYFSLNVSVDHLLGSTNGMENAASQVWTDPFKSRWTNLSMSWQQTAVPPVLQKLYITFSRRINPAGIEIHHQVRQYLVSMGLVVQTYAFPRVASSSTRTALILARTFCHVLLAIWLEPI